LCFLREVAAEQLIDRDVGDDSISLRPPRGVPVRKDPEAPAWM